MKVKKMKPMSIKRINMMIEETGYQLEKLDTGEIVMVGTAKRQVQPNLFEKLQKEE